MTSKHAVAVALNTYAEKKALKASQTKDKITRVTTELRKAFQLINRWVYLIEGLHTEEIAASSQLVVGNQQVGWEALVLNFADTKMVFDPVLKGEHLFLRADWRFEDEPKVCLRLNDSLFQVYSESGERHLGVIEEGDLLSEIIRIAHSRSH